MWIMFSTVPYQCSYSSSLLRILHVNDGILSHLLMVSLHITAQLDISSRHPCRFLNTFQITLQDIAPGTEHPPNYWHTLPKEVFHFITYSEKDLNHKWSKLIRLNWGNIGGILVGVWKEGILNYKILSQNSHSFHASFVVDDKHNKNDTTLLELLSIW